MTLDTLLYDLADDGVLTITVNRPDKLNALNAQVLDDLEAAFRQARADDAVRGVLLTGAGEKAFVAGADISQFPQLTPQEAQAFAERGQHVLSQIEGMPKPVVAAVNGFALGGGCELAMACHLRVASENARLGLPEVGLGILPGYGGTQRLPRLVGLGRATELVLTAEHVTAERAHAIGLVNRVAPRGEAVSAARELLVTILSKGPVAVRLALSALQASSLPLAEGQRYEAALFGQALSTEDAKEGATAFLERRKPAFEGR